MRRHYLLVVCMATVWLLPSFTKAQTAEPLLYINNFTFVGQPDGFTCGPVSGIMLAFHHGITTDVSTLKSACGTLHLHFGQWTIGLGTTPQGIKRGLAKVGLATTVYQGTLGELRQYTEADRLPIVLLRSGWLTWHYVVVLKLNEAHVYIADPGNASQAWPIAKETFAKAWDFSGDMAGNNYPPSAADGTEIDLPRKVVEYFAPGDTLIVPNKSATAR